MPAIVRIDAKPYDIPLKASLSWGEGHALHHLRHVLVRAELADGAYGIAEATPRPTIYGETQASILHVIDEILSRQLLGVQIDGFASVGALARGLARVKNNNTAKGALDMALHQALSMSRGESLAAYLGATRERIRLSTIVGAGAPDAIVADVTAAYEAGLRVFKIKIGRDISTEIETIARLVEAFPRAEFYVDANETLSAAKAAAILDQLHELGVMYCEEALPIRQLRERRQLRRDSRMPIIADDSAFTIEDLAREISFETLDILNIKTARTGYSESMRMLDICAEAGLAVMVGSQASSLLGCAHAAVFAGSAAVTCASECSFYLKTEADLSAAPPIIEGWLSIADAEESLCRQQAKLNDFA